MTDSPAGMSPHQLVRAVVGLVDADELPDELAATLNNALFRRAAKNAPKRLTGEAPPLSGFPCWATPPELETP